jgi:hypothetical protein
VSPSRLATLARLRTCDREGVRQLVLGKRFGSIAQFAAVLLSEYRRAVAAEQRYEQVRSMEASWRGGSAIGTAPRCVFQEFNAHTAKNP